MTVEPGTPFDWRDSWEIPARGHGVPLDALDGDIRPGLHRHPLSASRKQDRHAWHLPLIDTAQWIGREPEPQAWIIPGWLARGTGAMFVGEDGVGKSLLAQQLVTAVAANRPFMGLDVEQVPTLYVTCEDSANVLHMRQRAINAALGLPLDCAPAMLASLAGYTDVALGAFDGDGTFQVSPSFEAIERLAIERQAGLIVLDNVAHLFVGNENIRQQVAGFCSAIDRLAISCNAAVVVLAHPNKAGAEYSGSTGWSAHVRQRWFMERPEGVDRDARVLRKSKANYSQAGVEIAFRWHEWAFVRDDDLPDDKRADLAATAQAGAENAAFLKCLAICTEQRRAVSHNPGVNFYGTVFPKMPEGNKLKRDAYERAFERLLYLGAIELDAALWQDTHRHWKQGIKVTEKCGNPPAGTPCGDLRHTPSQVPQNATRAARAATPPYINISDAAFGAAPPNDDLGDPRTWGDQ